MLSFTRGYLLGVAAKAGIYYTFSIMCRIPLCLFVFTVLAPLDITGQTVGVPALLDRSDDSDLTAAVIVERALARAADQDGSLIELGFASVGESKVESLDGDGIVTKTETTRYLRYPLEGFLYDEVVEKNGNTLSDDEARKELDRKDEFVEDARAHAARGEEYEPNEMDVGFDRELMERYETSLVGSEVVRGHICWVINFEPRDGRLPDNRRMDKALNRSTGRLWISQDDYGVVRVAFEMQKPFRSLWGLAATLRHVDGQLDFERVEAEFWAPVAFDLTLDLRVFFKGIRRRIQQRWTDYGSHERVVATVKPVVGFGVAFSNAP